MSDLGAMMGESSGLAKEIKHQSLERLKEDSIVRDRLGSGIQAGPITQMLDLQVRASA